jgi:hypothetical protein
MPSDRHSYVKFYPSDWIAGTYRLPRLARSIYFDVCLFNWDRAQPCPPDEMEMMFADLAGQTDWRDQIETLIRLGKLIKDASGAVYSHRALGEARAAFDLWEKKSKGGKNGAAGKWASSPPPQKPGKQPDLWESHKQADGTPNAEPEPEPEPEPASPPKSPPLGGNETAIDEISDLDQFLNAWNDEAKRWDWPRVIKFTDGRKAKARARLKTHGLDDCLKAIKRAGMAKMLTADPPPQWFTFDFITRNDENLIKIMEGKYDRQFAGTGSSWKFD